MTGLLRNQCAQSDGLQEFLTESHWITCFCALTSLQPNFISTLEMYVLRP